MLFFFPFPIPLSLLLSLRDGDSGLLVCSALPWPLSVTSHSDLCLDSAELLLSIILKCLLQVKKEKTQPNNPAL